MSKDHAETGNLQPHLNKLGAALDNYLKFEHPDAYFSINEWQTKLDEALPQTGVGIDEVLKILTDTIIPNGSPVPNPGFTSFITTGATTASTLASTASSIASPQRYLRTAFNYVEELSLHWLAEMCGVKHLQGIYSSGGSVANLVALGGARQWAFEKQGHDPALHGIDRATRIYASHECHHTIQRSGGVLGLGRRAIKAIPCDAGGRMQTEPLVEAIESDLREGILPVAIVANAGSTNTGAIDPLSDIGKIAQQYQIWFHVDGAFGLPGILDERLADHYQGIEMADSVIVDPHKWLGASVGVAATFVRDREILNRAFTQEPADYLEGSAVDISEEKTKIEHSLDDFGIPYFDYGVELSAPCRGIVVWAMIKEIGVAGMRDRIVRHNDMAYRLADIARDHPKLELLDTPTLSICCFRYRAPEIKDLDQFNQRLHRQLIRENTYMPSTTRINGQLALRPCFVGARAEMYQVDGLVEAVIRIGDNLINN
ncbi:aminotransferase class V-fold PLP-dependent enzyme [Aliikangiella marina]|uniref:Aminotransferase class V-fold PLP-dependent enzyme n=1 Tax=Aliikangiella marina TaxID=1712262 RepID=A0A545TD88_9GAMM|nr:aminotransferase class V-fold PLP-dependent enzyme [Aliikangiella marina]TQV75179.1 aminotransferase class V-fold PLP-dependent enzyme [Aliikangiella marina]